MPPDAQSQLGPFRFRVDPERAAAFSREIGGDGAGVPMSYPAVWIADPALFDPVRALCDALDVVPVHESQNFVYESELLPGRDYDVSVTLRREETPPRLIVDACIAAPDGATVARSETMLRLVPRAGFGGGA